jgi:chromosome segregation ATPase
LYKLRVDKENYRNQLINLEDTLKDYEMVMGNQKQQNMNTQCLINSKEEQICQLEAQFNENRQKLKLANEEIMRLEDRISLMSNDFNNLKNIKEDLESKVTNLTVLNSIHLFNHIPRMIMHYASTIFTYYYYEFFFKC